MADYRDYGSQRYGRRSEEDDERYRRNRYGRHEDRGFFERAGDEVRSWFGDEEADRRRRMDEQEEERQYNRDYGREGYREGSRTDYGRGYGYRGEGSRSDYERGFASGREGYRGEYDRGYRNLERYGTTSTDPSRRYSGYGREREGYYGGRRDYDRETNMGERSAYDRGRYESGSGTYGERGYSGSRDYGRFGQVGEYDYSEYGQSYSMPYWSYSEMWYVPGPYTGRGPSGWRRSDERINEEINERLQHHGQIDASDIMVSVNSGEVTLSGSVNSRLEKRLAEDLAESCSGVREVHNNLRVSSRGQYLDQTTQQTQQTHTGQQTPTRTKSTTS